MFTWVEVNHIGRYSGDYSPCVGIEQSIEVHPWCPPHLVRHRNDPKYIFLYQVQHSARAHGYVKYGNFKVYTLYNKKYSIFPIIQWLSSKYSIFRFA